jgi:Zn-dependent protease with chaperone function
MAKHVENALKVAVTVFLIATGLAALGSLGGIFATLKTIEAGALAIMSFIGTLAGGLLSKGVEASRDNFGAKVSTRNGTAPRQIVYGQCRVGGTITHMETSGTDNSILSMVVVLAGHEIESLRS